MGGDLMDILTLKKATQEVIGAHLIERPLDVLSPINKKVLFDFDMAPDVWVESAGITVSTSEQAREFPALKFTATHRGVWYATLNLPKPIKVSGSTNEIWYFIENELKPNNLVIQYHSGGEYTENSLMWGGSGYLGWNKKVARRQGYSSNNWNESLFDSVDKIVVVMNVANLETEQLPYSISLGRIYNYDRQGAIMLDIDDGYRSVFELGRPLFNKYNIRPTFFVTTGWIGNTNFCTWKNLRRLSDEDGWLIGSHSVDHPDLTTLSENDLRFQLNHSQRTLRRNGLYEGARYLATPGGTQSELVLNTAAEYYDMVRVGGPSLPNWITHGLIQPPMDPYRIPFLSIAGGAVTPQNVIDTIDVTLEQEKVAVFLFHQFTEGPSADVKLNVDELETILSYISENNVPVITYSDYFRQQPIIKYRDKWVSGRGDFPF